MNVADSALLDELHSGCRTPSTYDTVFVLVGRLLVKYC